MNTLLNMAIGLSVTYLFFALLCSVVVELFAGVTSRRGKMLHEGIVAMLGTEYTNRLYGHPLIRLATDNARLPSYISSRLFALTLANLTTKVTHTPGPSPVPILVVQHSVPRMLRRSLNTMMLGTQGNEIHIVDRLQQWYVEMNEHLTGKYSRTARSWTLITAIALTVICQVDSVEIARAMARDEALRAGMVTAAGKHNASIKELGDALAQVELPIGWKAWNQKGETRSLLDWVILIILKVLGWSATVLAVQLGAPFWFEQLNRVMNVRLTKRPELT